eukprot:scaffold317_cov260-Pinguiococcus_pyrenoidosus.AAC.55
MACKSGNLRRARPRFLSLEKSPSRSHGGYRNRWWHGGHDSTVQQANGALFSSASACLSVADALRLRLQGRVLCPQQRVNLTAQFVKAPLEGSQLLRHDPHEQGICALTPAGGHRIHPFRSVIRIGRLLYRRRHRLSELLVGCHLGDQLALDFRVRLDELQQAILAQHLQLASGDGGDAGRTGAALQAADLAEVGGRLQRTEYLLATEDGHPATRQEVHLLGRRALVDDVVALGYQHRADARHQVRLALRRLVLEERNGLHGLSLHMENDVQAQLRIQALHDLQRVVTIFLLPAVLLVKEVLVVAPHAALQLGRQIEVLGEARDLSDAVAVVAALAFDSGHDAGHAGHDVGVPADAQQHHEHAEHLLGGVARRDIAVAYRGERAEGPVQRRREGLRLTPREVALAEDPGTALRHEVHVIGVRAAEVDIGVDARGALESHFAVSRELARLVADGDPDATDAMRYQQRHVHDPTETQQALKEVGVSLKALGDATTRLQRT